MTDAPDQARAERIERARLKVYKAKIARERTLGRLHVERLFKDLRQDLGLPR